MSKYYICWNLNEPLVLEMDADEFQYMGICLILGTYIEFYENDKDEVTLDKFIESLTLDDFNKVRSTNTYSRVLDTKLISVGSEGILQIFKEQHTNKEHQHNTISHTVNLYQVVDKLPSENSRYIFEIKDYWSEVKEYMSQNGHTWLD
jgi:hypothetical protein